MSNRGLPESLVASIDPHDARAYATASGWTRVPGVNGKLAVYSHAKSDLDQLLIPLDTALSDYSKLMAEVVLNLAEDEGRPATEVLNDLLLPPSDVLRFRLDESAAQSGAIPLEQGLDLLQGARKALLAAACSVVQPQKFHPRLSRTEAEQLLQACRLGQTERGSFTAVIACPLDAVGPPMLQPKPMPPFEGQSDVPDPFARRTTNLLMESVARVVKEINGDRVEALLELQSTLPPLSANLCEALLMMQPRGDRSRLTISATWARTLPPPPDRFPPSVVHLRRNDFPIIERLAEALRPARESTTSYFVGLVDALFGTPDEANRVSGDVQLLLLNQEGSQKARVNLNADDYHVAWEAHGVGGYVSLSGKLVRGERVHRIVDVSSFKYLND
jgi:hypothetical protein